MRKYIDLFENRSQRVIVYHGSPYGDITQFRTDNLRHRTGTPGTLSFTLNRNMAKYTYGKFVYTVEVQGIFGDFENKEDVISVIDWRKQEALKCGYYKKALGDDAGKWEKLFAHQAKEIREGMYAMWENKALWDDLGWDGAWCFESGAKNLIIGNADCVLNIIKVEDTEWD